MNELLLFFVENGILILLSIFLLFTVAVLAISNAEECPHAAECFDCKKVSCRGCAFCSLKIQPEQKALSSIAAQPDYCHDINRLQELVRSKEPEIAVPSTVPTLFRKNLK